MRFEDRAQQVAAAVGADSRSAYRALFRNKRALLVLDDVWALSDVEPFQLDPGDSRILYTSRDRGIAGPLGAESEDVGQLDAEQARRFLGRWSGRGDRMPEPFATGILEECDGLALGLAMVGAALKAGETVSHSLTRSSQVYLVAARGSLRVNAEAVDAGDGVAIADVSQVLIEATTDAEVVMVELQ